MCILVQKAILFIGQCQENKMATNSNLWPSDQTLYSGFLQYVQLHDPVRNILNFFFVLQMPEKWLQYLPSPSVKMKCFCIKQRVNDPPHTRGTPNTNFYIMERNFVCQIWDFNICEFVCSHVHANKPSSEININSRSSLQRSKQLQKRNLATESYGCKDWTFFKPVVSRHYTSRKSRFSVNLFMSYTKEI
jgi:hypothetical protein